MGRIDPLEKRLGEPMGTIEPLEKRFGESMDRIEPLEKRFGEPMDRNDSSEKPFLDLDVVPTSLAERLAMAVGEVVSPRRKARGDC